jgi:hypothetical protein
MWIRFKTIKYFKLMPRDKIYTKSESLLRIIDMSSSLHDYIVLMSRMEVFPKIPHITLTELQHMTKDDLQYVKDDDMEIDHKYEKYYTRFLTQKHNCIHRLCSIVATFVSSKFCGKKCLDLNNKLVSSYIFRDSGNYTYLKDIIKTIENNPNDYRYIQCVDLSNNHLSDLDKNDISKLLDLVRQLNNNKEVDVKITGNFLSNIFT